LTSWRLALDIRRKLGTDVFTSQSAWSLIPLYLSELRPPEYAQAKVYRCRVEGVDVSFGIDLEIIAVTAFSGLCYQDIGELLEDLVASPFVGGT